MRTDRPLISRESTTSLSATAAEAPAFSTLSIRRSATE